MTTRLEEHGIIQRINSMGRTIIIGEGVICFNEQGQCYVSAKEQYSAASSPNEEFIDENRFLDFCKSMDLEKILNSIQQKIEYRGMYVYPLSSSRTSATLIVKQHIQYMQDRLYLYRGTSKQSHILMTEWMVFWMQWAINNCDIPVFSMIEA